MAFGGGGGFTFGSNNNNQGSSFGGFGSNNNTTSTFGSSSNTGGAFGGSTTGNNPFATGGSTFGSNTGTSGGFGSNTSTGGLFGNKPTGTGLFGPTNTSSNTGGGLFGNTNTASTGFGSTSGGFGSTSNNAFGNTGGSTSFSGFGGTANKPAFGAGSTGGTLFGQGGAGTTGGFGASSGSAFGGSGTALGQTVPPSQGTAAVPFSVHTDKDPNNQTSLYQSINFIEPYTKYSFEELRLADYNAGRRYGNGAGQPAGGFGSSSFGGFGSNNASGGFGSNNTTTSNPFGGNSSTSGGFGSNTTSTFGSGGGGLFGQNKPASGGLFGNQSSGSAAGGLFGTSNTNTTSNPFSTNNTSTGFGSSSGGGGLFGNTNNQQKPGGLFGNTNTASTGGTGFSFGNNNQQQSTTTGGGLFGNTNNNTQSAGGLFGNNNQQKPGGLFGTSTSGGFGANTSGQNSGGLFGTSNNTSAGGGLFGNTNTSNTNTSGGLFGNNQSTTTGVGMFGNNNANQSKPGGLFGGNAFGNQQQQNTGGGLFGNNNQTSTGGGSGLFGNTNSNTSNAFSFGANNNQAKPAGTSLFGNPSTTNNQSGGLFGNSASGNSLFGNSMNQSQQQQSNGEIKHASLLDNNPYGQSSIWTGLPSPNEQNSKPLVTALVAQQNLKESQAKPPPNLRLNQSRYMTPPRRGYGFTYSTYGTPNSAASTPGGNSLSTSMYGSRFTGGSFGRSMGKSASIGNMRSYYSEGESVLAPGAFTPSSSRYSSGSIRRLTIDRSIRDDLFSRPALPAPAANSSNASPAQKATNGVASPPAPPIEATPEPTGSKLKKRVSFDKETTGGQNGELNGDTGAVVRVESDDEATPSANGTATPPDTTARSKGLAAVPEDRETEHVSAPKVRKEKHDPQPGEYWSDPTEEEIKAMPREQAAQYRGFKVGRQGCGFVTFDGAVDLKSLLPLKNLYGTIIDITVRSISVYPDSSTKPPRGKGLNVPSTLTIENSWPRNKGKAEGLSSGPVFDRHIRRLKAIGNTEFVSYDVNTGVWIFKVPHYTRYGLDYDDDDEDNFGTSQLSAPPDSIKAPEESVMEIDSDHTSSFGEDDTFHGKQLLTVPGGFGRQSAIVVGDDSIVRTIEHDSPRSEQSAYSDNEVSDDDEMDMAGSYPGPNEFQSPAKPLLVPGTPGRPLVDIDLAGDWAEQLQRTISPRKQNRDALRQAQSKLLLDREYSPIKPGTIGKKSFKTSIDVMHAIFDKSGGKADAAGFEFPYAKRTKLFDSNMSDMNDDDKAWHASFKPHFTPEGRLIVKSNTVPNTNLWTGMSVERSHNRSVIITGLRLHENIAQLGEHVSIKLDKLGVPNVEYVSLPFSIYAKSLPTTTSSTELQLYELLHTLFDDYEDTFNAGLNDLQRQEFADRVRKDRLSGFLSKVLREAAVPPTLSRDPVELALQHITSGNTEQASETLLESKNINLALLVAQLPNAQDTFQQDICKQIENWREQNVLSEIDVNIRAIYELLSGNTTISEGKEGPVEHKAATFSISEHFNLGWLTMFAVNLWYGTHKNNKIEDIIDAFAGALESGEEAATPVLNDGTEDPLWVVLRLYAFNRGKGSSPVFPQGLSALGRSSDWNSLSLFRTFYALRYCLPEDCKMRIDEDRVPQLIEALATEFELKGDVAAAIFALLHITDVRTRGTAIIELLLRNAGRLPTPPRPGADQYVDPAWQVLTQQLCIPESWLYQALALLARSEGIADRELRYLILAEETEQAHLCLVDRVAPVLVVNEDWEGLREVLDLFLRNKGERGLPAGWNGGGAVYDNFCQLAEGGATGEQKKTVLENAKKGVSDLGKSVAQIGPQIQDEGIETVRRRVAVREMAKLLVELGADADVNATWELPLTGEVKSRLGRELAAQYFVKVMSGGA